MDGLDHNIWYVLFDTQSYGPYTPELMEAFVKEGRVIPTSLISKHPYQDFAPASTVPVFQSWMNAAMHVAAPVHAPTEPQLQPQPQMKAHVQREPTPVQKVQHSPQETLFIVMAEVDPQTGMNFLRALQSFGHVQRIGDSVWLLHASHTLTDVKAALTTTLKKRDRLFIHDCFANQQGWQNIGADLDSRIREIWKTIKR